MIKNLSTLLFFVIAFSVTSLAQTPDPKADEKKALIAEIVALSNPDGRVEKMFANMLKMQNDIVTSLEESLPGNRQDSEVVSKAKAESEKMQAKVIEKFKQKIDMKKLLEEVTTEVYDKYYTVEQLRDLVAFYKTPTGKYMLDSTDDIMLQTSVLTSKKMMPAMMEVLKEVMEEFLPKDPPPAARKSRPKSRKARPVDRIRQVG